MSSPSRGARYAGAIALIVIGVLCGAVIPGTAGGTICTAIVGIGLVAVISLVFYDVGLSEDRDRQRDDRRRLDAARERELGGAGKLEGERDVRRDRGARRPPVRGGEPSEGSPRDASAGTRPRRADRMRSHRRRLP